VSERLKQRRSRRILSNVLALAVGALLGLTAVELVARAIGIAYPTFGTWDPRVGHMLRPGASGWCNQEGSRVFIEVSTDGLRDREHARAKSAGVYRIAILGDSFAEALQVEIDDTFWSVLSSRLTSRPELSGRIVEPVNFGVSGYGTAQEMLTLRHRVWDFDPDMILLLFYSGNDVWDNSRALTGRDVPYFVLHDNELILDETFRQHPPLRGRAGLLVPAIDQLGRLRLFQLGQQARALHSQRAIARVSGEGSESFRRFGMRENALRPPSDPDWEQAWQVTERLLREIHAESSARGAPFVLALGSNALQVHPDPSIRREFTEALAIPDLDYSDHRLMRLGGECGFMVITLAPALRDEAQRTGEFMHGGAGVNGAGHWNRTAHRIAGELLADRLLPLLSAEGTK
jgi:hypothetical protein